MVSFDAHGRSFGEFMKKKSFTKGRRLYIGPLGTIGIISF